MKKTLAACFAILSFSTVMAQQKEGKVTYERTAQLQISFAGANEEMQRMIPRSRTDLFELNFANNHSLWKSVERPNEDDDFVGNDGGGGGMQIRVVGAGANDVLYTNFDKGTRVEQRELMDKKFIVDDSIRPLKWKMTGETKNILNHNCMKATATQVSSRMQMNMNNGKMERREVGDTALIIAWFATDIPISAGPGEYQGQLPGLILDMDVNNGRIIYKATEMSPKTDITAIKEPTGKKHYTALEFRQERDKMMDEMQRNNRGGGERRVIRMN